MVRVLISLMWWKRCYKDVTLGNFNYWPRKIRFRRNIVVIGRDIIRSNQVFREVGNSYSLYGFKRVNSSEYDKKRDTIEKC